MNIRIKDVLFQIRTFFIPYLLVLAVCLAIKTFYTRNEIFFAVNSHNFPLGDTLAPFFTDLGNGWTTVALAAILLLYSYRKALVLASAYAVTSLSAQVVKYIFDAPRPALYYKNETAHIHFVKGVYILMLHSFPSGHTVTAFSTTAIIAYWCRKKFWGLPLLILAMLIGYSRMYLSEHFFEDVVVGSVLGVIITVVWLAWFDRLKFLQSPKWERGLLIKN